MQSEHNQPRKNTKKQKSVTAWVTARDGFVFGGESVWTMARSTEHKSKKYQGVYWRELENGDRSYFLRLKIDGKVRRFHLGKKSEGITEAFANKEKARLINASRYGEKVADELRKVKKQDPTFGELFDWYLERRELKESTAYHLQILRKVPFYNSRKVTREDVQRYLDELAATSRPATVTLRYRQIRAVFRYAIARDKYTYKDPTDGIDLPKMSGGRKRYLTPDETAQLLDAVRDNPRIYLFVKMSLCTGARIGTLLSVRREDIDEDGRVKLRNHKSGRDYWGYLDAEVLEMVKDKHGYVLALKGKEERVPAMQSIQYRVQDEMNRLFNTPDTPKEMRAVVHTLRHSVASQMVAKGIPLEVVSKILDHTNIYTTQIYAKVTPELIKRSTAGLWE